MKRLLASEISHGLTGISFSTAGVYISLQHIEAWLRIASLVVGIAVGVATFVSVVRKIRAGR